MYKHCEMVRQKVTLPIKQAAFQFYDREMKRVIEPREFEIMARNGSTDFKSTILTVI